MVIGFPQTHNSASAAIPDVQAPWLERRNRSLVYVIAARWKAATIEQFVKEADAYIHCYNEKRIKISLGSLSPIDYRKSLGFSV